MGENSKLANLSPSTYFSVRSWRAKTFPRLVWLRKRKVCSLLEDLWKERHANSSCLVFFDLKNKQNTGMKFTVMSGKSEKLNFSRAHAWALTGSTQISHKAAQHIRELKGPTVRQLHHGTFWSLSHYSFLVLSEVLPEILIFLLPISFSFKKEKKKMKRHKQ